MRLTLSLLAVAALAAPASAAVQPTPPTNCATYLAAANSGVSNTCVTIGESPAVPGAVASRSLGLTVLTGRATATLTCALGNSKTVVLDGAGHASDYVVGGGWCWVTVTATAPNTTAVATNTWGWVFY